MYHYRVQYTMTKKLSPGSKYHMVYWTCGRFFRGSKQRFLVVYVLLMQIFCVVFCKSFLVILSFFPLPIALFVLLRFTSFFFIFKRFYKHIRYDRARWAMQRLLFIYNPRGRRSRDRIAVGFMTTYWTDVCHHLDCEFDPDQVRCTRYNMM
jgi:hypothetical protein